ncbi:binding-protein-dependent transport systems inner membrane component [Desulforamulus reducens MI-1]|uniref:Binding-protein-dependent transport systems inner membrane component n=1 Tax=Desulforamulus reducens (strain ATCC BAA-1160 / DSM 100696 / MI-1) TaxID=349161 RepID=A4J7V6_DESRM|nr:methionine ABC transporter permease [Desulforamulus reducens]ABO51159.1 binding-protein-dependent transport systems inner membrane component [Desulforamulus reducens MI-1]
MSNEIFSHLSSLSPEIIKATWDTFYMTMVSVILSSVLGIPLGVILVITDKGHIKENLALNRVLGSIINIFRSFPFIILLLALVPFTRLVVGTTIGTTAAIVPLTVASAPFVARMIETSLKEVSWGVVEASLAMGASTWQIIRKVLLPEALPGIILGTTITAIAVIGYSAMAGVVGGGGLGDLAIRYGYMRFDAVVMVTTVVILIIMVQIIQSLGNIFADKFNKN